MKSVTGKLSRQRREQIWDAIISALALKSRRYKCDFPAWTKFQKCQVFIRVSKNEIQLLCRKCLSPALDSFFHCGVFQRLNWKWKGQRWYRKLTKTCLSGFPLIFSPASLTRAASSDLADISFTQKCIGSCGFVDFFLRQFAPPSFKFVSKNGEGQRHLVVIILSDYVIEKNTA